MQSASGNKGRGAAWAAPFPNLVSVLFAAIVLCCGFSFLTSQAASAQSHAEAYTEPYFEYVGSTYSVGLSLDPVSIDYLAIDPGATGEHRDVLAYVGKPSSLWLGIGGWGTHMPTKPGHVEVLEEEDKLVLTITEIEFVG